MALSFRASSYTSTGGASLASIAATKPVGAASGDVLWFATYLEPDTNTVTPPSGVVSRGRYTNAGLFMIEVFSKIAGGSEPATYTFTAGSTNWFHVSAVAHSGGTGSGTLVDVSGASEGDSLQESLQTAPSVTTTGVDRMLIRSGGNYNAIPTGVGAGGAAINFRGAGSGTSITDGFFASAGATGTTYVGGQGTDYYVGAHHALISDTSPGATVAPPRPVMVKQAVKRASSW